MQSEDKPLNSIFLNQMLVNANLIPSCLNPKLLLHAVYSKSLKGDIAKNSTAEPQILVVMLNLTFLIQ